MSPPHAIAAAKPSRCPERRRLLPPANPPRHHRDHAVHPAGGAGPDGGDPGGPGDRGAVERVRPFVLDRVRLSADLDRGHADLRQAVGHVRPARPAAAGAGAVHRGIRAMRAGAIAAAADRVPRSARAGWRRADGDGAGRDRGRRLPAGTRSLPGLHGRDVGRGLGRRAGGRRLVHRPTVLDVRVLDQRAAGPGRDVAVQPRAQAAAGAQSARPDRLSRRGAADGGGDVLPAGAELGRHGISLAVRPRDRPGRLRRSCCPRALVWHERRVARPDPAATHVQARRCSPVA